MTREEADIKISEFQEKAKEFSKETNASGGFKYGTVSAIIVEKTKDKEIEELVVGYMRKPTRAAKMTAMNYIAKQEIDRAGEIILSSSIIRELSDPRLCDTSTDDDVYMSAALICIAEVNVYAASIKKN